jgi:hypothetical protein
MLPAVTRHHHTLQHAVLFLAPVRFHDLCRSGSVTPAYAVLLLAERCHMPVTGTTLRTLSEWVRASALLSSVSVWLDEPALRQCMFQPKTL